MQLKASWNLVEKRCVEQRSMQQSGHVTQIMGRLSRHAVGHVTQGCFSGWSIAAVRHHADRRVGPARTEAAAIVAAAIEARPAPAVADIAVPVDVAPLAARN